ncbi:PKD domain-containing protein [Aureispira anguillae]|uniref:PKD domain-containing protein n=1 Tax=Aureispira anguillae TaxID=2864201 RepID=A0A916DTT3_9BACT|nr:PKD domain-containing protein [Aureispira anguillae]BDS12771.1 PKD domain-containing protein [Aureispira anguillae]
MKNLFPIILLGLTLTSSLSSCKKDPPISSISYEGHLFVGERIEFISANKDVDNYLWSFGDGRTVNDNIDRTPHTYTVPGTYTVELRISNQSGSHTSTRIIEVKSKPVKVKIKKVTIAAFDSQANWDPVDMTGPDIYCKIIRPFSLILNQPQITYSTSSIQYNTTISSLPLDYIYGTPVEVPFDEAFYIELYDDDNGNSDFMAKGYFLAKEEIPFTSTIADLEFDALYSGYKMKIEVEYIY